MCAIPAVTCLFRRTAVMCCNIVFVVCSLCTTVSLPTLKDDLETPCAMCPLVSSISIKYPTPVR